ncbi:hypothetical protein LYSHEL_06670 [Lysobacter helvus]|uniref:DUF4331 domain-containing protein n=2 Tax=Lysobacteraceae TaxID=32033 RepID=A0ABN6FPY8_9GAMM|nr:MULTISPECIES: DUF4331 domain-containing protein [Lysobacter]BCT91643.1 hypothetical protein LYSCAS_06670 [Lysobacter caseinilyticus]BCT94796.1 hypothetical protein LYSHEL_06670 [Lysobacter helvus]
MKRITLTVACLALLAGGAVQASSHREAPLLTKTPKVDGTDFYLFRSYETGRAGYVTLVANYDPLQDSYGGPNYFSLDPAAAYDIKIDNNGDALPDVTFRFRFTNTYRNIKIPVGGEQVAVPLNNVGAFSSSKDPTLNLVESYTVEVIRPGKPTIKATNAATGASTFVKPHDNIGTKSIPDYAAYANKYISKLDFAGCASQSKVFVGQRREGFSVNLGEVFDLIHTNPVGDTHGEQNTLAKKNVTSIAIEVPIACLTAGNPIIGAWTTASTPDGSAWKQVSRLSAPLVNEVVIGLPDKDRFNASNPRDDGQFAKYVTNPTLPALIEVLFPGVKAPTLFPRTDLVAAFLTGVDGLNQPAGVRPAEMMRLNTSIAPKTASMQKSLAVLAGDTAGFPNGRRPGDDVVDIELRVAMGVLLTDAQAPSRTLPYTDGAAVSAVEFRNTFPYLNTPLPGATD